MNSANFKSTLLTAWAYLVLVVVILFFAARVELLKSYLAAHRAYISARDARWEKAITKILKHIDREEAGQAKDQR